MSNEQLIRKWKPVLEASDLAPIKDPHKRAVTAQLLENTEKELRSSSLQGNFLTEAPVPVNAMGGSSSDPTTGRIDTFDPVMISLVRRAAPNLMAYDVCGVQSMTGPTGLVFAMRSKYINQSGPEAFYNEANTAFSSVVSGNTTLGQAHTGTTPSGNTSVYNTAGGMARAQAEALGTDGNTDFSEMAFEVEKIMVSANSRALAAGYTMELMQDLKAVHGLDAETELSNILSGEILAEINREVVRTIYITAVPGAQYGTTTAGIYDLDTDSNGRWMVEKFKGMMFSLDREANKIAKDTRRGKGNIVICSSDVASALQSAGVLSYTPSLANELMVDDTGNTFAGVLNNKFKVYIDPYATSDYYVVGYRGPSSMDAGLFYAPYTPLQLVKAIDPKSFSPRIGFKTRYGLVANPFAEGSAVGLGRVAPNTNVYYRKVNVANIS